MKKVISYLKDYQRKHFEVRLYLMIAIFLGLCFTINYAYNFEDDYVDGLKGTLWYFPGMLAWMGMPFTGVCLILYACGKHTSWLSSPAFWLRFFIGFSILAFDRTFDVYGLLKGHMSYTDYRFVGKNLQWCSSLVVSVLPLMLVYLMLEHEKPRTFYGLALKRFDPKPYFVLLGISVVFIGIGSFFGDIQDYYPRFQHSGGTRFAERHDLPEWLTVLSYELAYGSDFVSVEVFFRGFLIHAFVKFFGGYAVLPMIASYAFLHFGKPLTEAISSVFGGYILGIISYYSRNVWGGIIIHIGVAWAMEFFGYLQSVI